MKRLEVSMQFEVSDRVYEVLRNVAENFDACLQQTERPSNRRSPDVDILQAGFHAMVRKIAGDPNNRHAVCNAIAYQFRR